MPNFNITPEFKKELRERAGEILFGNDHERGIVTKKAMREFKELQDKAKKADFRLLDCCFVGPTSMAALLDSEDFKVHKMDDEMQVAYAIALEDMLGLSTKFVYDEKRNEFNAVREADPLREAGRRKYGEALTYKPEDLELGIWDKICAFFGVETEHAKKVAFIENSLKEQRQALDGYNKGMVAKAKNQYLEEHKGLYEQNCSKLNEAENVEKQWNDLLFEGKDVQGYKFTNGKKISALSACMAWYQNKTGNDLAKYSPEDLQKPENKAILDGLKEVAGEYQQLHKDSATFAKKMKAFNTFAIDVNVNAYDEKLKGLLIPENGKAAIEQNYEAKVPFDAQDMKNVDRQRAISNYPILKMKAELSDLFKKEKVKAFAPTDADKKYAREIRELKAEKNLYEHIKEEKYDLIKTDVNNAFGMPQSSLDELSTSQTLHYAKQLAEGREKQLHTKEISAVKEEKNIPEMDMEDNEFSR